jgi:branched-chain amino acid transport system ATP-binding protein
LLVNEIFGLIASLRRRGISILLAEQNARAALTIADRGVVIENGRLVMAGPSAELLDSPEIAERYLGVGVAGVEDLEASRLMAERLRACVWNDG